MCEHKSSGITRLSQDKTALLPSIICDSCGNTLKEFDPLVYNLDPKLNLDFQPLSK